MIEPTAPAAIPWYRIPGLPALLRASSVAWLPVLALLVGLAALIYLVQTSSVATTGYDIQELERERDAWRLRNEQLQLELSKVSSLAWIEREATVRLKMKKPEEVVYLRVDPGARARPAAAERSDPAPAESPLAALTRALAPWLLPGRDGTLPGGS